MRAVLPDRPELGPRFAAVVGRPPGWTPAATLLGDRLGEHVRAVSAARGAGAAVAGTLFLQQYAAILTSPVVAVLHEGEGVLPCRTADVSVSCVDGLPVRLAFARPPRPHGGDPDQDRQESARGLVDDHLGPAIEAIHALTRAGRRTLRGAVAHAVATAFLHLSWRLPDPGHHLAHADDFLRRAGLADVVGVSTVEVAGSAWLYADRRTCCLAFRAERNRGLADPYCANCPVLPTATVQASFEQAVRSFRERFPRRDPT